MSTTDRTQGMLFAGRYLLGRKLGSGGMADVWLAEDKELGRRVAVKILHERYASDEQFVERFRREATNAAGLSHPNIVSIFDRGEAEGSYFIVMEYVEGRTLKELVVTRGPCPIPVAISYTRQVLAALRYAHRHAIIHRDIKPHNVIVDHEGRVKVADFGIARAGASQITEAGSIIGTAQYLSPEQARGAPGRRELRPLLDRCRPLRAPHRHRPVQRGDAGRDRDEAHLADARGSVGAAPGDPARPRPRRAARAGEGARRPLPLGAGDGPRPGAGRPRRVGRARDRGGGHGRPRRHDRGHRDRRVEAEALDGRVRRRRALPRLRRPGLARSRHLAVAAHRGSRDRAGRHRLVPLRPRPGADRLERARLGQRLPRHPGVAGGREHHQRRLRAARHAGAERRGGGGVHLRASSPTPGRGSPRAAS